MTEVVKEVGSYLPLTIHKQLYPLQIAETLAVNVSGDDFAHFNDIREDEQRIKVVVS